MDTGQGQALCLEPRRRHPGGVEQGTCQEFLTGGNGVIPAAVCEDQAIRNVFAMPEHLLPPSDLEGRRCATILEIVGDGQGIARPGAVRQPGPVEPLALMGEDDGGD
jgi:hypothetical protein